ncbi:hypothetical protein ABUV18_03026 (plasmid) [Clavibacter nebraskensis]|uniref:hypothetical protein n=1 Tax=Clavibacter nebraskensis TaxID=31963 RepID=UPI003DA6E7E3
MISNIIIAAVAKSPRLFEAASNSGMVVAQAYCFPQKMMDAMDTAKLWSIIIAGGLGTIALIAIGVGMFFSGARHDGGELLKKLGYFIAGTSLIGGAAAIVGIFLTVTTAGCTPVPTVS